MLKIERLKDIIKNFDTVNSGEDLQCYLSRIATNQNYDDTCLIQGFNLLSEKLDEVIAETNELEKEVETLKIKLKEVKENVE